MKIKYILPLLLIAFIFASCSSEDQTTPETDVNLITNTNSGPSYGPTGGSGCVCDVNYVFPTQVPGPNYHKVHVIFDSSLSLDEIHCLKYEYFECEYDKWLFVQVNQPDMDPYTETWLWHKGKPLGDLVDDICNDPMTSSPECDD